jgi:signal transduction histidine kinase
VFALPTEPDPVPHEGDPSRADRDIAARAAESSPGGLTVLGVPAGEPASSWLFLYLNPQARTLLGIAEDRVGERLGDLVPGLAHLLDELTAPGVAPGHPGRLATDLTSLTVRARRNGDEVVVTVAPSGADTRVEEADAEVRRLRSAIAHAAHELRSPVSVIVGLSDAAQASDGDLPEDRRREMRMALLRQSEILKRLSTDLDTAAQAQRGSLAVELEPVDVVRVVRACLHATREEEPFEVVADQVVSAVADPSRLTQIVTNLISNARRYGEPPYEVHVSRQGDQVHLTVADRGDGVPEDFRPLLFEEFTRARQDAHGTGLGLFVVRTLAEAQGGAVDYQPRYGGGSLFTVRLPAL